jgi:hypothetical protein
LISVLPINRGLRKAANDLGDWKRFMVVNLPPVLLEWKKEVHCFRNLTSQAVSADYFKTLDQK